MFTTNTSGKITDTSEIPRLLAQQISAAVHAHGRRSGRDPYLHRIRIPAASIDILDWLELQPHDSKMFWSDRDDTEAVAAAGTADILTNNSFQSYAEIVRGVRALVGANDGGARYYGGFRFQPEYTSESRWESFGAYRFVLPRFELSRAGDRVTLFCNLVLPRDKADLSSILNEVDQLRFAAVDGTNGLPSPSPRSHMPASDTWQSNVRDVLQRIDASKLSKAVLARRTTFDLEERVTGPGLLKKLRDHTPACFHFLVEIDASTAFVGASPERLFKRRGRRLNSEAVAGTRPRGSTVQQDQHLARELSNSSKDCHEHRFVRQFVRDALTPLCERLQEDEELSIMKLATKQHLVSRFRGRLATGPGDHDLLETLHPTPAVAGFPTEQALETITLLESFDRGWYAAPVGWIGADAAEFAVAIRSALVEHRHLHLYAGAGIVEGSDPYDEWNELDQKISDFVQLLTTPANQP